MIARFRTAREERDQGFTLIELLVVIIVIGILAAIAIPVFLNQRKKGIDASLKSDLKNAATAAETVAAATPEAATYGATLVQVQNKFTAAGFKATAGNEIRVVGGPSVGYCLIGRNDQGSTVPSTYFWYDSQNGGYHDAAPSSWWGSTGVCTSDFLNENGPWRLLS